MYMLLKSTQKDNAMTVPSAFLSHLMIHLEVHKKGILLFLKWLYNSLFHKYRSLVIHCPLLHPLRDIFVVSNYFWVAKNVVAVIALNIFWCKSSG